MGSGPGTAGSRARHLTRNAGRRRHGVLSPPWVRARLAALSEPGSVQTVRSLAACNPALKVARGMRDHGMAVPAGLTRGGAPGKHPTLAAARRACTAGRADLFAGRQRSGCPWPNARVASSGARRPGHRTAEWPAADSSQTTPAVRELSATSRRWHLPPDSAWAGRSRPWPLPFTAPAPGRCR